MTKLLVTGADGFVGRHLCGLALASGLTVRGAVRSLPPAPPPELAGVQWTACGDIGPETDWRDALAGMGPGDAVMHLAGRAHQLADRGQDPGGIYGRVNVHGSRTLARAALQAGVRRFVFVSTILVHGRFSGPRPIREDSPATPRDPYARSKWEGEAALRALADEGLEPVIVRPCLVYGPGVKGNVLRLLRAIRGGWPLPLAGIRNARSLVSVERLCDLLLRCASHLQAPGETFVAADAAPVSTPAMVRALAEGVGRPARLFPVPGPVMAAALGMLGRGAMWAQLSGNQVVDAAHCRRFFDLDATPDTAEGLAETGRWYRHATEAR